jgi:hypothetical protein
MNLILKEIFPIHFVTEALLDGYFQRYSPDSTYPQKAAGAPGTCCFK